MVMSVGPWESGRSYGSGSKVVYDNVYYEIMQPHTSQADWMPPATPALWRRLEGEGHAADRGHGSYNPTYIPHPSGGPAAWQAPEHAQAPFRSGPEHHAVPEHGRGGGNGYDAWIGDAEARLQAFRARGAQAPTTWLLDNGSGAAPDALPVPGARAREDVRLCRRHAEGRMWLAARIDGRAHEVLTGDMRALRWHSMNGPLPPHAPERERLVSGGVDDDGTHVFVGVGQHRDEVFVGRCEVGKVLVVRVGSDFHEIQEYSVLGYL